MGSASLLVVKMALTPLLVKKNRSDYRAHGIQIDRLGLTVLMQNTFFFNICTESRDIGKNMSNLAGLVWKANFRHFLSSAYVVSPGPTSQNSFFLSFFFSFCIRFSRLLIG